MNDSRSNKDISLKTFNLKAPRDADLNDLTNEALNALKADKRVYPLIHDEFKLSKAQTVSSLAPLLDYVDDLNYCESCLGLENCKKKIPHFQMYLVYEDGLVEQKYRLCDLAKKMRQYKAHFLAHDFPMSWMNCSLQHDVERTKQKTPAVVACVKVLTGESSSWIYVNGNLRSGRSFLLGCFANDFVKKNDSNVAFCDTSSLVEKMKDYLFKDKDRFSKELGKLSSVPLLILDDFGNEIKDKAGYGYSNILFPLLNERAKNGLVTGFSSDFKISEIADMYRVSLGLPRAKQLQNLLLSMCKKEFDVSSLDIH